MAKWIRQSKGLRIIAASISLATIAIGAIAAPPPRLPSSGKPAAEVEKQPAKRNQQDKFPPSPLEFTEPDPLLPEGKFDPKRSLSQTERQRLIPALDALNAEATAQLAAGKTLDAFKIWNRELRLRRALGLLEEVNALGRVGDIAWKQAQSEEVQVITRRLQAIQTQIQAPSKTPASDRPQVLAALGIAYQQVRSPQLALSIYEPLLAEARQQKNATEVVSLLTTIGQLQLSWFKYDKAAPVYQELLAVAQASQDRGNEIAYLIQLDYLHEQAKQPEKALPYQQQLIDLYQQTQQPQLLPDLNIRMGRNYAAIGKLNQAEQTYQEAFTIAQATLQPAYAADALRHLGALYRRNDRLEAALKVYEFLIGVEQQAYSVYGMMDAYDQLGQIHLAQKSYPQAIAAFQQGLSLAQQINHRSDHFTQQIQRVSQQTKE